MTKNHDDLAALSPAHEASSYQAMPARLGTPGVRAVVNAPVGRFERDVGRDQIVNVGQFQPLRGTWRSSAARMSSGYA